MRWERWAEGRESMRTEQKKKRNVAVDQPSILVIDDEPLNMKLFTLMLARRGYRVLQAADGFRGFVLAHDDRPDLIIMDVRLPKLSGLEVTRTLKDSVHTKDIPIIVATAYLIDDAELRECGCDGHITKPFVIPQFMALVESIIGRANNEAG
jgi:two-component system, cell cycle response regulator DivK